MKKVEDFDKMNEVEDFHKVNQVFGSTKNFQEEKHTHNKKEI